MVFIIILIVLIFIVLFLFASPKLSPIPYYPSNKKDILLIIKSLDLRNNQTIYDLGAGDGIVIFEAAKEAFNKKLNTAFIAIEINPVLILILYIRRFLHPNKKNIKIVWGDMFKINLKSQISHLRQGFGGQANLKQFSNITIYLYISPWLIEKTMSIIKKQFTRFSVVSYFYPVKSLKYKEWVIRGVKNIYVYKV